MYSQSGVTHLGGSPRIYFSDLIVTRDNANNKCQ